MDLTPALILSMWTGGMAAVTTVVVGWRIIGPGFSRLSAIVVVLFAAAAAAAAAGSGRGAAAWIAAGAALFAVFVSRPTGIFMSLMAVAAFFLTVAAMDDSPAFPAVTGALFLGSITAEMMLGHWYLVDPQLPRWALKGLALGAAAALIAELAYLVAEGVFNWGSGDEMMGWAFVSLSVLSAALIAGVSLTLRVPYYAGVMAATGLSYLAVLTSVGVVVLGRSLAF